MQNMYSSAKCTALQENVKRDEGIEKSIYICLVCKREATAKAAGVASLNKSRNERFALIDRMIRVAQS
jgi:hypothetical protein